MNKNGGSVHFWGSGKKSLFVNRSCLHFLWYLSLKLVPITQGLTLLICWTHSLLQFHLNGNYDPIILCICIPIFSADWTQVTGLKCFLPPSLQSWRVSGVTHSWVWSASANGIGTDKLQMQGQIVKDTGKRHCITENIDFSDKHQILSTCITDWDCTLRVESRFLKSRYSKFF